MNKVDDHFLMVRSRPFLAYFIEFLNSSFEAIADIIASKSSV
jgi:hypothetical protein